MIKIPVLIDTDPGVDDAFAIMMAKASEKIDIKAITVTCGNVGLNNTLRNALGICDLLGIDAPVYKGAEKPMIVDLRDAAEIHGESGLGGYVFRDIRKKSDKDYAWDGIYKTAKEFAGDLTIIALGPLTNIAIALLKYPDLPKYIKRTVIMGGNFGDYGNCVPYSEFNFWIDPHAVEIVLNADMRTEIYGLDCTRQTTLSLNEMSRVQSGDPNIEEVIRHLEDFDIKRAEANNLAPTIHIPDGVAVAAAIDPSIFQLEKCHVTCVTEGGNIQGWSLIDHKNRLGKKPNTLVARKVDKEGFKKLLLGINSLRGDN